MTRQAIINSNAISNWNSRPSCHEIVAAYDKLLPGKLTKRGTNWEGPCPICDGTDRFAINHDGIIWCRNCQPDSSHRGKLAYKTIIEALAMNVSGKGLKSPRTTIPTRINLPKVPTMEEKIAFAKRLFDNSKPITNTKAVGYLAGRGITRNSDSLRYGLLKHAEFPGKKFPCLLGKIINSRTGSLIGVHRTYFELEGKFRKRHAGAPRGGGILVYGSLHDANIVITEGLEDAMSILQATDFNGAIWATCGTTFMQNFEIPEAAKFMIIAADSDKAGIKSANAIANKARERGLHGRIAFTPENSGDWNELLIADELNFIQHKMRVPQATSNVS